MNSLSEVNYWDLPEAYILTLETGETIRVRTLLRLFGKDKYIQKKITKIQSRTCVLNATLPLTYKNLHYTRLYSLMASEGSHNTEFRLNVPEKEFHAMFKKELNYFFPNIKIRTDTQNGVERSTAATIIRHLIKIPPNVPRFIMENKELSKEYLRIAFEAEGSAIKTNSKRYIKLSRNTNISNLITNETLPFQENVYRLTLKKKWPQLYEKACHVMPSLLLAEYKMLKSFGISSKLHFEKIRLNKTALRAGKVAARWNLYIYGKDINKFIEEIGFITKRKKLKCNEMLTVKAYNIQYTALRIIKDICDENNHFTRKDFVSRLSNYVSPATFLWRYKKKGIITNIGKGKYRLNKGYESFINEICF